MVRAPTPVAGRRDGDPSSALLDRIAEDALNPAYHERAGRRRTGRRGVRPIRPTVLTLLVVAVAGMLVGVLVVAARERAAQVDSERGDLIALAQEAQDDVAERRARVDGLTADVAARREEALGSATVGEERAAQIEVLGMDAGTQAVRGPGARVVLADGDLADPAADPATSRVLDLDLQRVVNGLWEAGAEAVAVNGERVGALTSIRSRAEVILVNYTPVVSPYEVEAIGDPRRLPTDFVRTSGGEWLQLISSSAGVELVGIDGVSEDMVLQAEPVAPLQYARPASSDAQEGSS